MTRVSRSEPLRSRSTELSVRQMPDRPGPAREKSRRLWLVDRSSALNRNGPDLGAEDRLRVTSTDPSLSWEPFLRALSRWNAGGLVPGWGTSEPLCKTPLAEWSQLSLRGRARQVERTTTLLTSQVANGLGERVDRPRASLVYPDAARSGLDRGEVEPSNQPNITLAEPIF